MKQTNERGIALVLSLFLLLAVSIVGASLMFLSQTETYSSLNYQMMSQARYGAESGIQKAANYLLYTYAAPSTGGADSIASYVTTVSPVTYNGNPVILSANSSIASNYPVGSVQTAFSAAVQGSLTAGTTSVQYAPYATLVSMEEVPASQSVSGSAFTIQTWQITADGSISTGQRKAQVQVTAIIDTQKISSSSASLNYAAFATAATCGAIQLSGSAATDSYDSSTYSGSGGITSGNGGLANSNGNVGTNGNLTESGSATINGTLSTPRVGVGSCSSGNVTAETTSGSATVTGGLVQLPQAVSLAAPTIAAPNLGSPLSSTISITGTTTCASLSLPSGVSCSGSTGNLTFTGSGSPVMGNISISGTGRLTMTTGTYTLNAVSVSGSGTITMGGGTVNMASFSTSGSTTATLGGGSYNTNTISISGSGGAVITSQSQVTFSVVNTVGVSGSGFLSIPADSGLTNKASVALNVVNTNGVGNPISLSGSSIANPSFDPSRFIIQYGGTGSMSLSGSSSTAAVIYAPNAPLTISGSSAIYGEFIASTLTDSGGARIHYDRNLANKGLFGGVKYQAGNPMMSAFSWKKY